MSPSKMRKTHWFHEGAEARAAGEPRDSNPYDGDPSHYVRRRAWWEGWDTYEPEPEPEPEMLLVPREPTIEMILALADLPVSAQDVWERMLAAYEEAPL